MITVMILSPNSYLCKYKLSEKCNKSDDICIENRIKKLYSTIKGGGKNEQTECYRME